MEIDRHAPVVAATHILIAADRQTVWNILTDFERWPEWNASIRTLSLKGPVAPGSTFEWKAGPGTIRSKFAEVDPPHKIAWTGTTFGIEAVDVFQLHTAPNGTLLAEEESWNGILARLFRSRMGQTLQGNLDRGVRALKAEAERRVAHPGPSFP